MASTFDPRASTGPRSLSEPPACGPARSELRVLLAAATDPGVSTAGLVDETGLSHSEVVAVLARLVTSGYLSPGNAGGREGFAVEWDAPVPCGWCSGATVRDALALARQWSDEGDAVAFSRAAERLAWGPRRDLGMCDQ